MHGTGPIFVSYAREDDSYFHKIRITSSKPMHYFWWDAKIKRSDPNWRAVLDSSIKKAAAVFVVCSPNARASSAVSAEIEIAVSYKKPIYPIWFAGSDWAQSAPFSLITYNYTDIRDSHEWVGPALDKIIDEIIESWPKLFEDSANSDLNSFSRDFLSLVTFEDRKLYFKPACFEKFYQLLQAIYLRFLSERFSPFTYGSEWCMHDDRLYFLPATWALDPGEPVIIRSDGYMESALKHLGIVKGRRFAIEDVARCLSERDFAGFIVSRELRGLIDEFSFKGLMYPTARKIERSQVETIDTRGSVQYCANISCIKSIYSADHAEKRPKRENCVNRIDYRNEINEEVPRLEITAGDVYLISSI
jgi:hypothetical protein